LRDNGYSGAWSLEPHVGLLPHAGDALNEDAYPSFVAAGQAMAELVR
jgi:L-ribulose-5-phosphate 3-epimerase